MVTALGPLHVTRRSCPKLPASVIPALGLPPHHQFVTTPWHWRGLECRVDVKCSDSVPMTSAVETSGDRRGCEGKGGEVRSPVSTGPRAVSLGPLPQEG